MKYRTGIGQDSHRFLPEDATKPCILGGFVIPGAAGFQANSDGDIIFHAICNAITSVTGILILGSIADDLFHREGITDSLIYLQEALKTLGKQEVFHVALAIEGNRPRIYPYRENIMTSVARAMDLKTSQVGLTATSGEGLTDFGCGIGLQCFCILTTVEK